MSAPDTPFLQPPYLEVGGDGHTVRMPLPEYLGLLTDEPKSLIAALTGDPAQTADYLNAVLHGAMRHVTVAVVVANVVHQRFDNDISTALGTLIDYLRAALSAAEQSIPSAGT